MWIILLPIVLIFLYYLYERWYFNHIRRSFLHVIHVNGIRGKSSVTRMIANALSGNYRVFCKTTGSEAATIDVHRQIKLIRRLAPPNIKEQMKIMKQAYRMKAEILVIECMALHPALQRISHDHILQADICVMTNIRIDHQDIFGFSHEEIAWALSHTCSKNTLLWIGDAASKKYLLPYIDHCKVMKNLNFFSNEVLADNLNLAFSVAIHFNIDPLIAIKKIQETTLDCGAFCKKSYSNKKGVCLDYYHLLAANDLQSTELLYQQHRSENKKICLLHSRSDRPLRSLDMVKFIKEHAEDFEMLMISGGMKPWIKRKLKNHLQIKNYSRKEIQNLDQDYDIYAIGNTKGFKDCFH